jgi:hypothetical protein
VIPLPDLPMELDALREARPPRSWSAEPDALRDLAGPIRPGTLGWVVA